MKNNKVIILKLGGSLLSDKTKPFSFREKCFSRIVKEIVESSEKISENLIIVHGGGSFGHPVANEYQIQLGHNKNIDNQNYGLGLTHLRMQELNFKVTSKFMKQKIPVMSLSPVDLFFKNNKNLKFTGVKQIENLLQNGIIPILFGDVLLHSQNNFSILSGDRIIAELCSSLAKFSVSQVIFATDQDGIIKNFENEQKDYQSENNTSNLGTINPELIKQATIEELKHLDLESFNGKIDVTGGLDGKIDNIELIFKNKKTISICLINGLRKNYIKKALLNEEIPRTQIFP